MREGETKARESLITLKEGREKRKGGKEGKIAHSRRIQGGKGKKKREEEEEREGPTLFLLALKNPDSQEKKKEARGKEKKGNPHPGSKSNKFYIRHAEKRKKGQEKKRGSLRLPLSLGGEKGRKRKSRGERRERKGESPLSNSFLSFRLGEKGTVWGTKRERGERQGRNEKERGGEKRERRRNFLYLTRRE